MLAAAPASPTTTRAIIRTRYGAPEVLELRDVRVPDLAEDGVRIRVHASSVNPLDWHELRGEPYLVRMQAGPRRPREPRLGSDVAGVVEAVGASVADLAVGDRVLGVASGAWAELVTAKARSLVRIPDSLGFPEAAALPVAGITALQAVRDHGGVRAGQQVLIVGASGGVGHLALQIAKSLGAEVTAVARTANLEMVRALGADHVIDHLREDWTAGGPRFDVIVDAAGMRSVRASRRALKDGGTYVVVGGPSGRWLRPMDRMVAAKLLSLRGSRRSVAFLARINSADIGVLADMVAAGTLRPVIDRALPLAQTADAVRYQEQGHTRGKVVLTI